MSRRPVPCPCRSGKDDDGRYIVFCPLHTAAPELLAIIEDILESGGYDDDGDFYLYHREGPTPQDDFLDPEPIAKARELVAKIRSA